MKLLEDSVGFEREKIDGNFYSQVQKKNQTKFLNTKALEIHLIPPVLSKI